MALNEISNIAIQRAINQALKNVVLKPGLKRSGHIIRHLSEEDRNNLKQLRSKDISQVPNWIEK